MQVFSKLMFSHYRAHWFRMLVATVALTASVAMVVVVAGGYAVTTESADKTRRNFLGRFDFVAASGGHDEAMANRARIGMKAPAPAIGDDVLAWLRSRADVAEMVECCETKVEIFPAGKKFRGAMHNPGQYIPCSLTGIRSEKPPRDLKQGEWLSPDCDEAVLDSGLADRLSRNLKGKRPDKSSGDGPKKLPGTRPSEGRTRPSKPAGGRSGVGGTFQIGAPTGSVELGIHGVLDTPAGAGWGTEAVYVTDSLFERLTDQPFGVNRVLIDIKDGADPAAFKADFDEFIQQGRYSAHLQTRDDYESRMGMRRDAGGMFSVIRYAGAALAVVAAMFIVFNTFSMGVQERIRQLAILRTVGMTRWQVGKLIVFEAVQLALIGWLAGLAIGWTLLHQTLGTGMGRFGLRSTINFSTVALMAAVAAFGATVIAALIPAWLAGRKRPLDAVANSMSYDGGKWSWWLPVLGLPMVLLNPLATFTDIFPQDLQRNVIMPVSFFTSLAGFAMLSPLIITTLGRVLNRAVGALFCLDRRLLKRQYAAGKWQTIGCFVAMMVGMGLFVVVQTWGSTMLRPFLLGSRAPDAAVTVFPDGIPREQVNAVKDIAGIETSVPMIVQHPALDEKAYRGSLKKDVNRDMLYIGCDMSALIGGKNGMIEASFVRGSEDEALKLLRRGGYCLITEDLYIKAPELFDVGESIELETVEPPRRIMAHEIAGVIHMPGWHLLTMSARMRRGLSFVGGAMFVSEPTAAADFPSAGYKTFWLRLAPGVEPESMEQPFVNLVEKLRKENAAFEPASAMGKPYCRVTDTAAMTTAITARANSIIEPMTKIPLIAISLGALAVASTLVVSIHARSWDIGIIRSIGLTRWQLIRQVLAEGIVICLLGCAISLMFGLLTAWTSAVATAERMGVSISFVIPWGKLSLGLGAAVLSSLVACLWPAVVAARKQPLDLLQAGRSNG